MALSALSGDEQGVIFVQLCNVLDPGIAVALSSVSNELRTATRVPLQQLKADHEAAAALCRKLGPARPCGQGLLFTGPEPAGQLEVDCKALREAKDVCCSCKGLTADELKLLGTLGSVLPALEELALIEPAAGPDGVQQLAAGLGAGALPAVIKLRIIHMHVGAGASALAAALGKGALPRLKGLELGNMAIGDAGLVALAPALRQRPALEQLSIRNNLLGDEGLAALVAPPPPAGAPPPTTGALANLRNLQLYNTQITDAGCATLAAALDSGALPALERLDLSCNQITDAGCATLAAALDSGALPALEELRLFFTKITDAGCATLAAARGLAKLEVLDLSDTQITDAGCATLAAALDSGALPALKHLDLKWIPASAAAKAAVYAARANLKGLKGDEWD